LRLKDNTHLKNSCSEEKKNSSYKKYLKTMTNITNQHCLFIVVVCFKITMMFKISELEAYETQSEEFSVLRHSSPSSLLIAMIENTYPDVFSLLTETELCPKSNAAAV